MPTINKWMCSRQCPCPSTEQAPWRAAYSQSEAVKLGRTWSTTDTNDADGTVQFYWPSVNSTTNDYQATTFYDCYFSWKSAWISSTNGQPGQTPEGWSPAAQGDFEKLVDKEYAFSMFEYMEVKTDCSGICTAAIFPFATPVSTGIPT